MEGNIHKGHRERLRERFRENGLKAFSDIEAIELLLFYALPRCNTNEIAHKLLKRFGSFKAVMEADISELKLVEGVGENAAMLIRLVSETNARYLSSERSGGRNVLRSTEAAGEYLKPLFAYAKDELAFALSINSAGGIIHCHQLANGMINRVEFSARQIVEIAIRDNCAYMILAHNHLSDVALPSRADASATKLITDTLASIGVCLVDHIIVSGDEYVSMRESGYFAKEEK